MSAALDQKWQLVGAMAADASLSGAGLRVGIAICRFDGDAGCCFASFETLASASGLKRRATINAVQELETKRWIRVERGHGRTHSNRVFPAYEMVHSDAPFKGQEKVHGHAPFSLVKGARNDRKRCTSVHPNASPSEKREWGASPRAQGGRADARRQGKPDPSLAMLAAGGWGGGDRE